jgi:hypothetical protein
MDGFPTARREDRGAHQLCSCSHLVRALRRVVRISPCLTSLLGAFLLACDGSRSASKERANDTQEEQSVSVQGLTLTHELGETAHSPHFNLRVESTKRCIVEPHFKPPAGVEKLGVLVHITGNSEAQVPVNPFYALLINGQGERFEATLLGCKPQLVAQQVTRGQEASGWVTFDVPEASQGLRFVYAPVVIGAERKELTFHLERALQ